MNKKSVLILMAAITVVFVGAGAGYAIATAKGSSGTNSGLNPAIFVGCFIPIFVAVTTSLNPTTPVTNLIFALSNKRYSQEKKIKYLDYYVSRDFKSIAKYASLLDDALERCKQVKIIEQQKDRAIIRAELVGGDIYEFEVIRTTKENSLKHSGNWIVNDYRKV